MEISEEELTKIVFYNQVKIEEIIDTLDDLKSMFSRCLDRFITRHNKNLLLFFTLQQHPCVKVTSDMFGSSCVDFCCVELERGQIFVPTERICPECKKNSVCYYSTCLKKLSRKGNQKRYCQKCILSSHGFKDVNMQYINSLKLSNDDKDLYELLWNDLMKKFDISKIMKNTTFRFLYEYFARLTLKLMSDQFYFEKFEKNRHNFPYIDDNMYNWNIVYVVDDDEPFVTILYCFEKRNINLFLA